MSIETSETKALPVVDLQAPDARLGDKAPKTMEQVRAARYEAAAAAVEGGAATAAPAGDAAKTPVSIDMDEAALKAATALSREAREAKARAKEFEAKAAAAAPALAAMELIKQGKHAEAIKVLGADLNAAVAETLAGPGEVAEQTPEAKELARQAAELEALKARDAERTERDKSEDAKRFEAARQADVKAVGEYVKKEAAKYPFLSRSDAWVADAYEGAVEANATLVKKLGRELTDAERHALVLSALEEGEATRVAEARLYAPVAPAVDPKNPANVRPDPPPSTPSARPTTFSGDLRGGTASPVTKQRSRMTFEAAKRARRESTNG